jgi:hypothetical protein
MQDKMEALKTAMRFFLKSLPSNSIFNICSFGSSHSLMWPESRSCNQENVDAAMSYTSNHFAADMGGTELFSSLRHVVQTSNSRVNTEIIILTDGQVWDYENIFEFIRETRSPGPNEKTRFFCLGIGEAVSHHLVTGIGLHGGGLGEVVPADTAGNWMRKLTGMLGAALTPSSWKIEIVLDDVPISDERGEERVCIQAPHHIPEYHAFSRSSIYFLFSQELKAEFIKVKATAVGSRECVTVELPIENLESGRPYVHLLAAKAVLGDLESGQSWLHEKSSNNNSNVKIEAGVDNLARIEGEKIGAEWSISSQFTSFIVVDDRSSQEKPSRWYRAEKSDLAELTRPRLGGDASMSITVGKTCQPDYTCQPDWSLGLAGMNTTVGKRCRPGWDALVQSADTMESLSISRRLPRDLSIIPRPHPGPDTVSTQGNASAHVQNSHAIAEAEIGKLVASKNKTAESHHATDPPLGQALPDLGTIVKVEVPSGGVKTPSSPLSAGRKGSEASQSTGDSVPIARHANSVLSRRTIWSQLKPENDKPSSILPKSYCFSADGKMLILWTRAEDYVFASNIPEYASAESNTIWNWKRYDVSGVQLVSGGGARLAVVSKVSSAFCSSLDADFWTGSTAGIFQPRSRHT